MADAAVVKKQIYMILPGPARDPSIVKSDSIPVIALAKPFPVKTTFWSLRLPELLMLLARDLLIKAGFSSEREVIPKMGAWSKGNRFHANLNVYSPVSIGVKHIFVLFCVVVSVIISSGPEGLLASSVNAPLNID